MVARSMPSRRRRAIRFKMAFAARTLRIASCGAFVVALSGAAHAEEGAGDAAYRAAIEEAIAAFESSDLAAARAAFERAHALSPSARTFRGIGLAAFRQGDYVAASANFRAALDDARKPLSSEQRAEATRLLARADALIGHVTVTVTPPAASIRFDGRVIEAGHQLEVTSGAHVLRADLAGYQSTERQQDVPPGVPTAIRLELFATSAGLKPTRAGAPDTEPHAAEGAASPSKPRLWTWVALGAAPVFAGAGLAIWLSGLSDASRIKGMSYTDAERHDAEEKAGLPWKRTWSTVGYVAGGVALGTGIVLYFVEGGKSEPNQVSLTLTGTGAYARGTF
jgi:tetratricopeptide (TPR) repeat protein